MRLLDELMFGLGEDRALRWDGLRDTAPMSVQNDGFSPMTCGCAGCASKVDYAPTITARGQFGGDFSTLWTFQGEPTGWQSQLPNDGPQEVNESGGDVIAGSIGTTFTLTLGQVETGRINTVGDRDYFRVELVAGQSYEFTLNGTGGTPLQDAYLELRNSSGTLIHLDDDGGPGVNARLLFTPTTSGTYYINARAWDGSAPGYTATGDYTITFNTGAPQDPLDTLDLGYRYPIETQGSTIYVYFARANNGENWSGDVPLRDWTAAEIASVMSALAAISAVTPLVFTQVFTAAESDFRLSIAELGPNVLGHFFPLAGNGAFDPDGAGWNSAGMAPGSLGYATIIHEILHGLGLAHPHYDGGDVQVMQGVTSEFNVYGTFLMNQGVFTTMSYNDGWASPFGSSPSFNVGSQGTPMALDIAYLQSLYGATAHNTGDNIYALTAASGAYRAIWDTGGIDTIQFAAGTQNVVIDLRAATLQTAIGGGGYVSYVSGFHAGWTIANGVVIENATGASGADRLIGNAVANVLTGNDGDDTLEGGDGDDTLNGGDGFDSMSGGAGNDTYFVNSVLDSVLENFGDGIDTVISSITYTLGANFENLTLLGAGSANATGNALNNLIIGNGGANFIAGGAGADTMQGGANNDIYEVDDIGDVVVETFNEGIDLVQSSVAFTLGDNVENLTLFGPSAINGTGNALNNAIVGNDADNVLNGAAGADSLTGGLGNDTYIVDDAGDIVTEAADAGTDTVQSTIAYTLGANLERLTLAGVAAINGTGNALNNTLTGNGAANLLSGLDGNDLLDGAGGEDMLLGGIGNDTVYGRAGADTLDGGVGADSMFGGDGDDAYYIDDAGDVATDNGPTGGYDTVFASISFTLTAALERLELTGAATHGTGNELANYILGNSAANVLSGRAGADQIFASIGNDTVDGGDGADLLNGEDNNDLLDGGNHDDTLNGGAGADILYGRANNDTLDGGAGADTMYGGDGDDTYYVEAGDVIAENAGAGTDTVYSAGTRSLGPALENLILTGTSASNGIGNVLANQMTGNSASNILNGFNGGDTLSGEGSADTLNGGNGDDTIFGGDGDDLLDGGNENDTAHGGADNDRLFGRVGNDILNGDAGLDTINGGDGDDTLNGGGDADLLDGGNNNDVANGGDGGDTAYGRQGNDALGGDAGNDTLFGGDGDDTVNGGDDNDQVDGGNGADRLDGGAGIDTLNGGADADTFVFSSALGAGNVDTIIGFSVIEDSIELDISIFTGIGLGALDANAFVIGSAATDSDDRIIYDPVTGALYYDADGDGAGDAVQFASLSPGLALTHTNFFGAP